MQPRPGVVEAGRDRVDPRAVIEQALGRVDAAAHASVDECVINYIWRILAPSAIRIAERPGEFAGLGLEPTFGIEESLNQVEPADPGRDAQVVDARALFE